MVDQLWLWCIETWSPESSDKPQTSIFTCFPRKEKEAGTGEKDIDEIADIYRAINNEANKNVEAEEPGRNVVALIVEKAVNTMLREKDERSLDILDVFRSAIGSVVSLTLLLVLYFLTRSFRADRKTNKVLPKVSEDGFQSQRYK